MLICPALPEVEPPAVVIVVLKSTREFLVTITMFPPEPVAPEAAALIELLVLFPAVPKLIPPPAE